MAIAGGGGPDGVMVPGWFAPADSEASGGVGDTQVALVPIGALCPARGHRASGFTHPCPRCPRRAAAAPSTASDDRSVCEGICSGVGLLSPGDVHDSPAAPRLQPLLRVKGLLDRGLVGKGEIAAPRFVVGASQHRLLMRPPTGIEPELGNRCNMPQRQTVHTSVTV